MYIKMQNHCCLFYMNEELGFGGQSLATLLLVRPWMEWQNAAQRWGTGDVWLGWAPPETGPPQAGHVSPGLLHTDPFLLSKESQYNPLQWFCYLTLSMPKWNISPFPHCLCREEKSNAFSNSCLVILLVWGIDFLPCNSPHRGKKLLISW